MYGDPVLTSRATEIEKFDSSLEALANDMLETMDAAGGVGLAANQIGLTKRIFVYDCSYFQTGLRGAIINPVWTPLGTRRRTAPRAAYRFRTSPKTPSAMNRSWSTAAMYGAMPSRWWPPG